MIWTNDTLTENVKRLAADSDIPGWVSKQIFVSWIISELLDDMECGAEPSDALVREIIQQKINEELIEKQNELELLMT